MRNSLAQLDKFIEALNGDAERQKQALLAYVKRLEQARDEIDHILRRATHSLRSLEGKPLRAKPDELIVNNPRMKRAVASERRGEAAKAVYAFMASKARGTMFTFRELQDHFDRSIYFMWPRIQKQWNQAHPNTPINNNGKPRAERRYFL